uniref:Uncharacterized protein n=1 Tax=Ascaris lumbricoides TaxID=6252 RepID=A0A0M3I642_ASCLU
MAREKMSSNTADEAAASNEERPSAPTCRSNIPVKKKLSNKRSGEMAGGGGNELSANSGTYQSFGRKGSGCNGGSTGSNFTHTGFKGATQRGNKTLGCMTHRFARSSFSYSFERFIEAYREGKMRQMADVDASGDASDALSWSLSFESLRAYMTFREWMICFSTGLCQKVDIGMM